MSKIIKVEKCEECKNIKQTARSSIRYCKELIFPHNLIKDTIHPDCPLEDAEDVAVLKEKAAKWDKVKEIAERDDDCNLYCPRYKKCQAEIDRQKAPIDCPFMQVAFALEGEKEEGC